MAFYSQLNPSTVQEAFLLNGAKTGWNKGKVWLETSKVASVPGVLICNYVEDRRPQGGIISPYS